MKHTKGPWMVDYQHVDPSWGIVVDKYGSIVANVNAETGPDATSVPAMRVMPLEDNARLIAAAPELLEALKLFVQEYNKVSGYPQYIAGFNLAYCEAKLAIDKATGGEDGTH
jgi:hypothetical protein